MCGILIPSTQREVIMEQYHKAVELWQSWHVQSPSDIDQRLDSFRILFAYHSGKIENDDVTYNDTREIFENGKIVAYTGSPRAIFEQQNQKLCYEVLKPKIAEKEPLSLELIQEIHRVLTSGTYDEHRYIDNGERPGEFKKHDYVTGINEVGSLPEDVPADLSDLLEEIAEVGASAPLKAGAYFHARFEYIHPFADGNGRVGRTLMNYWLMTNDYPPLVIYEEDRKDYYDALRQYDEEEKLDALISFLQAETVKTWGRYIPNSTPQAERKGLADFI